jgi:N-acetylglutamate synthase-like GNAT family acetyltransferase
MPPFSIRLLRPGESSQCERILRALPDWFGIESALVDYVASTERMETFVAESDGGVVGFLTLHVHNEHSAEIHVMAVDPDRHRGGIGAALVSRAEAHLRGRAIEFLQVKTLGPSRPWEPYERTRRFYARMGFLPLEENHLWGDESPCLILVKHLRCAEA